MPKNENTSNNNGITASVTFAAGGAPEENLSSSVEFTNQPEQTQNLVNRKMNQFFTASKIGQQHMLEDDYDQELARYLKNTTYKDYIEQYAKKHGGPASQEKILEDCQKVSTDGYKDEDVAWAAEAATQAQKNLAERNFYDKSNYFTKWLGMGGSGKKTPKANRERMHESGKKNWWRGEKGSRGMGYTINKSPYEVTASSRQGSFFSYTRTQAHSLLQGLAAAGLLGKDIDITLHTNNPSLARKQIKSLVDECRKKGIPLSSIRIKPHPDLVNEKGFKDDATLEDYVMDARNERYPGHRDKKSRYADWNSTLDPKWAKTSIEKGALDKSQPAHKAVYNELGTYDTVAKERDDVVSKQREHRNNIEANLQTTQEKLTAKEEALNKHPAENATEQSIKQKAQLKEEVNALEIDEQFLSIKKDLQDIGLALDSGKTDGNNSTAEVNNGNLTKNNDGTYSNTGPLLKINKLNEEENPKLLERIKHDPEIVQLKSKVEKANKHDEKLLDGEIDKAMGDYKNLKNLDALDEEVKNLDNELKKSESQSDQKQKELKNKITQKKSEIEALKKGLKLTGTPSSERENLKTETLEKLRTSWNKRCALKGRDQDQIKENDIKKIADQYVASVKKDENSWRSKAKGYVSSKSNTLNVRKFKDAAEKRVETTKGKGKKSGENVDIDIAKRL